MGILEYILLGLSINVTVITAFIVWALRIREEIGYQLYDKLREGSVTYSPWILILWAIPYIGVWSVIRATYAWHKIEAQNKIERLDIFMHQPPGFIAKHFVCKDTTTEGVQ